MKNSFLIQILKRIDFNFHKYFIYVLFSLFSTAINLIFPIMLVNLIKDSKNLSFYALVPILSLLVLSTIVNAISIFLMSQLGLNIIKKIKSFLNQHMMYLPMNFFKENASGELANHIEQDVEHIEQFLTNHIPTYIQQVIITIGTIIILFIIDYKFMLIIFMGILAMLLIIFPIGKITGQIHTKIQSINAKLVNQSSHIFRKISGVKINVAESYELNSLNEKLSQWESLKLKQIKVQMILAPVMTLAMVVILVSIISYGGIRITQGTLTIGTFIAMLYYLIQVIPALLNLTGYPMAYQNMIGATKRLKDIYEIKIERQDGTLKIVDSNVLRFDKVSFGYDQHKILSDFSLILKSGEFTALVGPSGAGKSTILDLIMQLYDVQSGQILYGETAINQYHVQEWRKYISYVDQENLILGNSIRENLLYGMDEAVPDYKIKEVLEKVKLTKFVDNLDALVGEDGTLLSGGEKQRLLLAHMLLKPSKIYLFDEVTSHLDSDTEYIISQCIQELSKNSIVLVVAHRLSTIKTANKIVFLDHGKITGIGQHQELLASHDKYIRYIENQKL